MTKSMFDKLLLCVENKGVKSKIELGRIYIKESGYPGGHFRVKGIDYGFSTDRFIRISELVRFSDIPQT